MFQFYYAGEFIEWDKKGIFTVYSNAL